MRIERRGRWKNEYEEDENLDPFDFVEERVKRVTRALTRNSKEGFSGLCVIIGV